MSTVTRAILANITVGMLISICSCLNSGGTGAPATGQSHAHASSLLADANRRVKVGHFAPTPSDFDVIMDDYFTRDGAVVVQRLWNEMVKRTQHPDDGVIADPKALEHRMTVDVGGAAAVGPATAAITIVEFSDLSCESCALSASNIKAVQRLYGSNVRLIYRHNPLPFHPNAMIAARAVAAAQRQGKFWEMRELISDNQNKVSDDNLELWAKKLGLELDRFSRDMNSRDIQKQIDDDIKYASDHKVRATPSFFINGVFVQGFNSEKVFPALLHQIAPTITQVQSIQPTVPAAETEESVHAAITIVEFGDFQEPDSRSTSLALRDLVKQYKGQLRLVFQHNPWPYHSQAMIAARAAAAAQRQGKFWEMHDLLFENQDKLSDENIKAWAKELALDPNRFKRDMDSIEVQTQVYEDEACAQLHGAKYPPGVFLDGVILSGALPEDRLKEIIDTALVKRRLGVPGIDPLIDDYIKRKSVDVMEGALDGILQGTQTRYADDEKVPLETRLRERIAVDAQGAPARGSVDPEVTIIEFGDFQCPFCKRAEGTISDLLQPDQANLRVVFRQNPLPFHPNAMIAARAALAAQRQGKFWEMHDRMFQNQQDLTDENFKRWASEFGLDVERFSRDMNTSEIQKQIDDDIKFAYAHGAGGTPSFFINGVLVVGAQKPDAFREVINAVKMNYRAPKLFTWLPRAPQPVPALDAAKRQQLLMKFRITPAEFDLLATDYMSRNGTEMFSTVFPEVYRRKVLAQDAADAARAAEELTKARAHPIHVNVSGLPSRGGNQRSDVTIVEFGDFECPFCRQEESILMDIVTNYKGSVRLIFRHNPFSPRAMSAARAAAAAQRQGKFWEMHDLLFQNQTKLSDKSYLIWAKELGLDAERFARDMNSSEIKDQIADDQTFAKLQGLDFTPSFFINGVRLLRDQSYVDLLLSVIYAERAASNAAVRRDGTDVLKR
jgi:protein-disulfide isomerase